MSVMDGTNRSRRQACERQARQYGQTMFIAAYIDVTTISHHFIKLTSNNSHDKVARNVHEITWTFLSNVAHNF